MIAVTYEIHIHSAATFLQQALTLLCDDLGLSSHVTDMANQGQY